MQPSAHNGDTRPSRKRIPIVRGFLIVLSGIVLIVIAALALGGLFLPQRRVVAKSVSINAQPSELYPLIANLKEGWPKWSPLIPERAELRFDGPEEGVGASQKWLGKVGAGSMAIVHANSNHGIGYRMEMGIGGVRGTGQITFRSEGATTQVTWADELQLDRNPILRWVVLAMDGMRSRNLERGLERLKIEAERLHTGGQSFGAKE